MSKSPLSILLELERLRLRKDEEAYFAVASRLVFFGQKNGWIDAHMFTILCELRAEVLGKDGVFILVTIPNTTSEGEDEDGGELDYSCLLCSTDVSELPDEKLLFHYECGNKCTVLYCKPCLLEWILNRKETFDPHGWVGCNYAYCRTRSFRFLSRKLEWKKTNNEAGLEDVEDDNVKLDLYPEAGYIRPEGSLRALLDQLAPAYEYALQVPSSERQEVFTFTEVVEGRDVIHTLPKDLDTVAFKEVLHEASTTEGLIQAKREIWAIIKITDLLGFR